MCSMTGKVVCTELILWIESILHQVVSPDSQQIPVFLGIVGISFYHAMVAERITMLPLSSTGMSAPYICPFAIGYTLNRVPDRFSPAFAGIIVEDTGHHAFHQVYIVSQKSGVEG